MKVKELQEILKDLNPELEIILQKDPEGNGYHHCQGAGEIVCDDLNAYRPDSVYELDWTADDNCMEEDEWEEMKNDLTKRAVVIFP